MSKALGFLGDTALTVLSGGSNKALAYAAKGIKAKRSYDALQKSALGKKLGLKEFDVPKFTTKRKVPGVDTQKEATKKLVSRTSEDHEPTIQEAVAGKDVVTETAKKYTSLTNDQVSDLRKIIAGKDSKELQRIFKLAERRMEAGDASDVEKDVFALIQEYLVSIRPIAAYGGSVDKALTGRSRDI